MSVSTHVLDAVAGAPAVGVPVVLDYRDYRDDRHDRDDRDDHHDRDGTTWTQLCAAHTDADGRVADLGPIPGAGVYRLRFDVEAHHGADGFYPEVVVVFRVVDVNRHHHVPLLLSPYAYSTYRGS